MSLTLRLMFLQLFWLGFLQGSFARMFLQVWNSSKPKRY